MILPLPLTVATYVCFAIIIAIEEWKDLLNKEDIEECWEKARSWILLYQIALDEADKRDMLFTKLGIIHNKGFYQKLFQKGFSFYKKSGLIS